MTRRSLLHLLFPLCLVSCAQTLETIVEFVYEQTHETIDTPPEQTNTTPLPPEMFDPHKPEPMITGSSTSPIAPAEVEPAHPSRSGGATIRQGKADVRGELDVNLIRRIVHSRINEIRHCYNLGLTKNPQLQGRLEIDFTIEPSGRVSIAELRSSSLAADDVGICVAKAMKRMTFPKAERRGSTHVVYTFALSP